MPTTTGEHTELLLRQIDELRARLNKMYVDAGCRSTPDVMTLAQHIDELVAEVMNERLKAHAQRLKHPA